MKNTNPYLIEKIIKRLKILTNCKGDKTKLLSETIAKYLQILPELKTYINENISDNESKIYFELGKYLRYSKYHKGNFIKHSYDSDNYFYMIFSGDIAKMDIKYKRIYLSFKEYLTHLIKLKLLDENYVYLKCIKKNQKTFPFDEKINVLTTKDINIDNYQQLIKKIKDSINNSSWIKNMNKKNNIEDFLELYNPGMENTKLNFIGKETKYPVYLPFYIFDKIMNPISFIGQLTKPKGIKFLSAYICLNISDIFYIDKTEIDKNNNLYNLFQRRVSEDVIKKLFEGHFFFKDTDKSFLIKNYSKYFYVQKIEKGQKLIEQNTPYEGIYFINNGSFQITTLRSYNELNDLHFSILHALDDFPKAFMEYQSRINEIEKQNIKNEFKKNIFEGLNQTQISRFTELKKITFNTYAPDVVGLNDMFDNITGLNNFSVECLSDEAEVFFLPKEIVTSMITEDNINSKISEFIGKQIMQLIGEINKYKESFERTVQFEANTINDNRKNNNILFYSLNSKNMSNFMKQQNKNYISKYKYKNNYSTDISNTSNNNTNFSTQKLNNFLTFSDSRAHSRAISKTKERNDKYPNILLRKIIDKNRGKKENKIKIKFRIDSPDTQNNKNKTFFNNFRPYSTNSKINQSIQINNKTRDFLNGKDNINLKDIIGEENKNEFNSTTIKFKINNTDNDKIKLFFNKTNHKGILKKTRERLLSHKSLLNYRTDENKKNSKKNNIKKLAISLDNKKIIKKKLLIRNKEKDIDK